VEEKNNCNDRGIRGCGGALRGRKAAQDFLQEIMKGRTNIGINFRGRTIGYSVLPTQSYVVASALAHPWKGVFGGSGEIML
jgi:hypothetical protein